MYSDVEPLKWAKAHFFVGRPECQETMNDAVVARVTEIAERVGQSEGIEIVEVRLLGGGKRRVLRIVIDKPEGVTHADCELVTEHVGTILDVEDVIPGGSYTFEVSSPGIERPLLKPGDYERFAGRKTRVTLREPVDNRRHWEGTLVGIAGGVVTLEPAPGTVVRFPLHQVEKANLKVDW